MSDEVLEALLSGENQEVGDLTGVPEVTGDEVLEQLQPEKVDEEVTEVIEETEQPEVVDHERPLVRRVDAALLRRQPCQRGLLGAGIRIVSVVQRLPSLAGKQRAAHVDAERDRLQAGH